MNIPITDNDQIITIHDREVHVPLTPVIPFIEGDGVGPEVWKATRQIVDAAVDLAYLGKRAITWKELLAGEKAFQLTGDYLPDETIKALRKYHVAIKGPLNTPVGEGIRSLTVVLRKELDLYACFRPVKYYPGAPSPLRKPEHIDIALFRENTEDVYTGIEFDDGTPEVAQLLDFLKSKFPGSYAKLRFPSTSAIGLKPISREGTERIVRTAVAWALLNKRKSATIIHKGNIMKFTEGGFLKWGYDLAEREFAKEVYTMRTWKKASSKSGTEAANKELDKAKRAGKLILKDLIVDASFDRAITRPQEMDVLICPNLNADYLSDALAALVGGLGIAPGANINFDTGDAIFESVHGTAPDIAGQNKANPCSLILSAVLMLRYMAWNEAANLIENGLRKTLASKNVTPDFCEQLKNAICLSTTEFTEQVIQRM